MKKYILLAIISFFINPSHATDTNFLIENETQVKIAREAIKKAVNDGVHPDEYFHIAFVALRKSLKYRADTKENHHDWHAVHSRRHLLTLLLRNLLNRQPRLEIVKSGNDDNQWEVTMTEVKPEEVILEYTRSVTCCIVKR